MLKVRGPGLARPGTVMTAPGRQAGRGGAAAARTASAEHTDTALPVGHERGIRWRAMPADFPHWQTVYEVLDGSGKRPSRTSPA